MDYVFKGQDKALGRQQNLIDHTLLSPPPPPQKKQKQNRLAPHHIADIIKTHIT